MSTLTNTAVSVASSNLRRWTTIAWPNPASLSVVSTVESVTGTARRPRSWTLRFAARTRTTAASSARPTMAEAATQGTPRAVR
jgi:hypothetical protein